MTCGRIASTTLATGLCATLAGQAFADAPVILAVVPNAPGAVTIVWHHSGQDIDTMLLQRQQPAMTWEVDPYLRRYTDLNLQPSTVYRYRVCAVFENEPDCSDWADVQTQDPEQPPPPHPKPPPVFTGSEAFHEPSRIQIRWRKAGDYKRVIVRWWHESVGANAPWQVDVDSDSHEGFFEAHTPLPGTYVFLLKGCTLNFAGATNCGDWSAPIRLQTAPPGVARVNCVPGTLKPGSPRFEQDGRATYHFENSPAGSNTANGFCEGPDRTIVANYVAYGFWDPRGQPGAWDTSGANATETITLTFGEEFSPERAPRRPLPPDAIPVATITFMARAQCDRDPWLNVNAVCRRTGDNVPADIRAKWPAFLNEPFPHTRNAIPADARERLLSRYNVITGTIVDRAPAPDNIEVAQPKSSTEIQGEAPRRPGPLQPAPGR